MAYISLILIVLCCGMLCVVSVYSFKKLWNPIFLCCAIIGLGSILCFTQPLYNRDYFSDAFLWISIGLLFLTLSFLAGQSIKKNNIKSANVYYYNLHTLQFIEVLSLIFSIIMLVIKINEINQIGSSILKILFNASIRSQLITREQLSSIPSAISILITIIYYWSLSIAPLAVQYKCRHSKKILVAIIGIALFRGIIGLSKEAVLVPIIIIVTSLLANYKNYEEIKFIKKNRRWIITVVLVVVVMSTIQRGYVEQGFYSNIITATIGTIGRYISIPIYSIATLFHNRINFANGAMCFRPVYNTLSYFGIGERLSAVQVDYGAGNVYTMFGNMYVDFGYIGIVILSVFFGFIFGVLYDPIVRQRLSHQVTNGIICMVMFLAFFDFQFIESIYVYTILFAFILEMIFKRKFYVNGGKFENTLYEYKTKNCSTVQIRFRL